MIDFSLFQNWCLLLGIRRLFIFYMVSEIFVFIWSLFIYLVDLCLLFSKFQVLGDIVLDVDDIKFKKKKIQVFFIYEV